MSQTKICLASDNWAPAHPLIVKAVVDANVGVAAPYGADPWTEEAQQLLQNVFKRNCKIFMVPNGTGANVFALKLACRPFDSVVCTDMAHIHVQESGATEAIVGCKLLTVPHKQGKLTPDEILKKLNTERAFGKHSTFPRVVSISQPTEVGTIYSLEELKDLSNVCKSEDLLFHIDGSRFYNAAASLKSSLHEIVEAASVDILSLGGTKNGLMGAESVLIFNSNLTDGSDYMQKQTLQLLSKTRYLSAQYIPFIKNDLWRTLANQANQKAQEIAAIIKNIPHLTLSYRVETNQIFFAAPAAWIPLIQEKIFCYTWHKEKHEIRFIASWNTSEEDVVCVKEIFSEISQNPI